MKKIQAVSLALGLALFVGLIYSAGVGNILHSIRLVGSGFLILIFVSGVRHLLRALAWRKCIEEEQRQRIGLLELFNVRLAGEAIRYVSFTGPLLGEPSKAALIRKRLPMAHGLSSVIVENLTYTLGAILITLSGMALLLVKFTLSSGIKATGVVITVFMVAAAVVIQRAIARRSFALVRLMAWLEKTTGKEWFRAKSESVRVVEENIYDFYNHRGATFFLVLALELGAHLTNIFEVFLILRFINVKASFAVAFIIEAAMKLVNFAFFFVPGQVGVFEGGNALLLKALGLGVTAGVTLALVEKIRTLVWTAYGLLALTLAFRKDARSSSVEQQQQGGGTEAGMSPQGSL
ncbi:MAG: lysylphosphatidylglycerol synthase domain-containing protein [Pyrinomonadaceae bacterium]